MRQIVLKASEDYREIYEYVKKNELGNLMLVCGKSIEKLRIGESIDILERKVNITRFSDFDPNPSYDSVVNGVNLFRENKCDSIIAIGGGSAIDVAKCIKLYSNCDTDGRDGSFLKVDCKSNGIRFLAVPTTAGSGAEATRFAVIYYKGKKQSIADESIRPDTVVHDASVLTTLPLYQKKSTALDALCHGIESFWSINSTDDSRVYSRKAIELIAANIADYIAGDESKNLFMQEAAYIAGCAINVTQTTAGHAMAYGLTSMYGISHGHAVSLVVRELWPWMIKNIGKCTDKRGDVYLKRMYKELAGAFGSDNSQDGFREFQDIVDSLQLMHPMGDIEDVSKLTLTVNATRLSNNPICLSTKEIRKLYQKIIW